MPCLNSICRGICSKARRCGQQRRAARRVVPAVTALPARHVRTQREGKVQDDEGNGRRPLVRMRAEERGVRVARRRRRAAAVRLERDVRLAFGSAFALLQVERGALKGREL